MCISLTVMGISVSQMMSEVWSLGLERTGSACFWVSANVGTHNCMSVAISLSICGYQAARQLVRGVGRVLWI